MYYIPIPFYYKQILRLVISVDEGDDLTVWSRGHPIVAHVMFTYIHRQTEEVMSH